jgi:hypothetical protein
MAVLKRGPAVCPNGHAMDEGLFNCPACGAYRPSPHAPKATVRARCCGIIYEHGGLTHPEPCYDCPHRA